MHDEHGEPGQQREGNAFYNISHAMIVGERLVFLVVGVLLFAGAVALAWRSVDSIIQLFTGASGGVISAASDFLNLVLLILMIAEIAYTVTLSVRGVVLSPQPFLIVGLIAVIRRILVITVQEVQPASTHKPLGGYTSSIDLAILTLVVVAFVFSIYLLRKQRPDEA
jgi:hypothetical protein